MGAVNLVKGFRALLPENFFGSVVQIHSLLGGIDDVNRLTLVGPKQT